jgi:CheY-like chemotaxis protein
MAVRHVRESATGLVEPAYAVLPARRSHPPAQGRSARQVRARRGVVLVVDDQQGMRELCRVILELAGYAVIEAADGKRALDALGRYRPHAVILDLMMPVMDGWEVLTRIQDDPALASVPVVVVSACAGVEDRRRAVDLGAVDYLHKPFDARALTDAVEQAMAASATA